jgi:uncharacterized membrane protein
MENSTNNTSTLVDINSDYSSIIGNAIKQYKIFWKSLLLVAVINIIVSYIFQIPSYVGIFALNVSSQTPTYGIFSTNGNSGWYSLYQILILIITIALTYGYAFAALKAARGEKPSVIDLFIPSKRFITVVISGLLLFIIIVFSFMLLIIPGVFFSCRLAFVPYLVVDKNKGVFSAIGESWEMTKGHFWKIFLLGLTIAGISMILIVIYFIFTMVTGGGNLFYGNISNMWAYQLFSVVISLPVGMFIMLFISSLYHAITLERDSEIQTDLKDSIQNISAL